MSRPLLKFGGGSVEILRDVLPCDAEADPLIAGTKRDDEPGPVGMPLQLIRAPNDRLDPRACRSGRRSRMLRSLWTWHR